MNVTVKDLSADVIQAKDQDVKRALEIIGLMAEGYAKVHLEQTPRRIDTSRLQDSIAHKVHDDSVEIGTNVYYGIYVEFGTVKMEANNYLRSAVDDHLKEYRQVIQEQLQG